MNIFVLDLNIKKCARYHCDRHVVKMILESAQMLSSALRLNGWDHGYKVTHPNHPCTIWTRASLSNWKWLRKLASWNLIQSLPLPPINDLGLTAFAQAMPEKYKNKNPVLAYRSFYLEEKTSLFQWTKRTTPLWIRNKTTNNLLSLP